MQKGIRSEMHQYGGYVLELRNLLKKDLALEENAIAHALDGQAYTSLRALISVQKLRESGAFFTGNVIAERLVGRAERRILEGEAFYDPACGAGNLLLAAAKRLPIAKSLVSTLKKWGELIYGHDIHPEFIEATKLRLILLAKQRGKFFSQDVEPRDVLPNIRCADALSKHTTFPSCSIVLMNPPYNAMVVPDGWAWGKGRVSAAAVFMEHVVRKMPCGGRVYALLPEVIRCGTRYKFLRNILNEKTDAIYEESLGVFDRWTDIDVFAMERLIVDKRRSINSVSKDVTVGTVGDFYHVHVGPLVDFRALDEGVYRPYVDAGTAVPWDTEFFCTVRRRFNGTIFMPPFVVIRRTSRPGDAYRAVGTIVRGDAPVAVENHLLVAIPKKRQSIKACKDLLQVLRQSTTNEYLDKVMRCRHLTVGSVRGIPWTAR